MIPKSGRKSTVKMKKTEFFFRGKRGMTSATDFPGGQQADRSCKTGNMVCLSATIRTVLRFQKIDTRFARKGSMLLKISDPVSSFRQQR